MGEDISEKFALLIQWWLGRENRGTRETVEGGVFEELRGH